MGPVHFYHSRQLCVHWFGWKKDCLSVQAESDADSKKLNNERRLQLLDAAGSGLNPSLVPIVADHLSV